MKNTIADKIFRNGALLLVFTMPWQTRLIIRPGEINGGYSEYLTLSLYATDLLLLGLLVLWAVLSLRARRRSNSEIDIASAGLLHRHTKWGVPRKDIVFIIFLAWIALSVIWAPDKALAVQQFFRLALAASFTSLAFRIGMPWSKIAWAFVLSLVIPAGLAIAQFFFQEAWPHKWLGLAAHAPFELGQSVIETDDGRWLRAYGPFDHPNILGGAMAAGLLAILFLLNKETRRRYRLALLAITPFVFAAMFFSFSRAAWLALALALAFLVFGLARQRRLLGLKTTLYFLLILGIQAFLLNDAVDNLVSIRIGGQARLEQKSIIERNFANGEAVEIWKTAKFVGVGAGNYILALTKKLPGHPSYIYQPPHNIFLLILAEIGLIGVFLFVLLLWNLSRGLDIGGVTIIFLFFIISIFDHWMWSLHFGILFIGIINYISKVKIYKIK